MMSDTKFFLSWKTVARLQAIGQLLADYLVAFVLCTTAVCFFPLLYLNRFAPLNTAAIFVLIFWIVGLYKRERSIMNILETQKLCRAMLFIFLILGLFLTRMLNIHALLELTGFTICVFVVIEAEKFLFFKLDQRLLQKGIGWERVIIYNNEERGKTLAQRMFQFPKFGKLPIGFLVDKNQNKKSKDKIPILGNINDNFEYTLKVNRVDTVIISNSAVPSEILFLLEQTCRKLKIKFELESYLYGLHLNRKQIDIVDGIVLLDVQQNTTILLYRFLKRMFDLIFSTLLLLVTLPLFIFLVLLIKHDSSGAAIFKQERVGEAGKLFTMFKFRTMYAQANKYDYHPRDRNDERITRIGRILRRTSLDELPQILNIIKGEMSLVGPRPEMSFIVEKYDAIERQRLLTKPGLTGLWQISTDRSKPIHENTEYDLYYVQNQSPLLDLAILLRTIISVFRGSGAF